MSNLKPKAYHRECHDRWPKKCTLEELKEGMVIRGMNPCESGYYRMHILKIFKETPDTPDNNTLIVYKYYGYNRKYWHYAVAKWWKLAMYMEWE